MSSTSLHLVCPHCNAVNRVPGERLQEAPHCGQCHRPLFVGAVLELNSSNFERQLKHSDLPLLVDFWAPWCGPCRMMAPAFAQAASRLEPQFRLAKLNTEAEPALAASFGIRSIPTLILFQRGRELGRQSGALSEAEIVRWSESIDPRSRS